MKKCKKCGVEKEPDLFQVYDRATGRRRRECLDCTRERQAARVAARGEEFRAKRREYAKEWREARGEGLRTYQREHAKKESSRTTRAAWKAANRDKVKAAWNRRRERNPMKVHYISIRSRHKKMTGSADGVIGLDQFIVMMNAAAACCYCGCRFAEAPDPNSSPWLAKTPDRIDSARGYEPDNLCVCCWMCNRAKGDRPRGEFIQWLRAAAIHAMAADSRSHTCPLPIPDWAIVDFTRYCLGRMTYQVGTTADWLVTHWQHLPDSARRPIRQDVERVFCDDDAARAGGHSRVRGALGMDCDRREWERVRALWSKLEADR